jgi:dihydroneopterin triphosphate diphosphatase
MLNYKKPESVLVVIYVATAKKVLMLRRNDDPTFWQSVTGSLEDNETPRMTAIREGKEETSINIVMDNLPLIDTHYSIVFDIFPQFLHRYAPGVTKNKEHWFYLPLPHIYPIKLTEHSQYQWLDYQQAAALTKSINNRDAILRLPR